MSKPVPGIAYNLTAKNLIVPTAVITATAWVTLGVLDAGAHALLPPLKKLVDKLEKENNN